MSEGIVVSVFDSAFLRDLKGEGVDGEAKRQLCAWRDGVCGSVGRGERAGVAMLERFRALGWEPRPSAHEPDVLVWEVEV